MIYLRRPILSSLWVNLSGGRYYVCDGVHGPVHTGSFASAESAERARANEQARWDACTILGK